MAASARHLPRHTYRHHVRLPDGGPARVLSRRTPTRQARSQSGQVMVLVAVALLALIGSAALVLLAGSVEWQKNQLQELADSSALDSALKIGVGCDAAKATAVITEADNFLASQRTRTGALVVTAGTCATPLQRSGHIRRRPHDHHQLSVPRRAEAGGGD